MKKIDDRLWSAYLDGELSITEVEHFENQLSPEELAHIRKEKELEKSIVTTLKDNCRCPDQLWKNICTQIDGEQSKSKFGLKVVALVMAAAAALTVIFFNQNENLPVFVPTTVAELEKQSQTGASLDDVNNYLTENKVDLQLLSFSNTGHHVEKHNRCGKGKDCRRRSRHSSL